MRKILVILCLSSLFTIPARASTYQPNDSTELKNEEVKLETKSRRERIQILFWQHHRYKTKTIDEVIDSNSNVVLKTTSFFICSEDACDDIKFSRIIVKGGVIQNFKYWAGSKYGKILTYNFKGEKIKKEKLLLDDLQERYLRQ